PLPHHSLISFHNTPATSHISTLSLHDALPISWKNGTSRRSTPSASWASVTATANTAPATMMIAQFRSQSQRSGMANGPALAGDRRAGFVAQPFLDQAAGDRIAARPAERAVLGHVLGLKLLAGHPARAFELRFVDVVIERFGLGVEADHHRGGERPGLRGTIGDVLHPDLHLLVDLAGHGVLEALARLD